ncbi:MAG: luciferase domain-containing protein [Gaiellales bacterium]
MTASTPEPRAAVTSRRGPRPDTTPTNPHQQLTQNAPPELQRSLLEQIEHLDHLRVGASGVSVPGAIAFHLPDGRGPQDAFMVGVEFAHLHPSYDGSLHMTLPAALAAAVVERGWGEYHPLAGRFGLPGNIVMIYGPRDDDELDIVRELVETSYRYALAPQPSGAGAG